MKKAFQKLQSTKFFIDKNLVSKNLLFFSDKTLLRNYIFGVIVKKCNFFLPNSIAIKKVFLLLN